jgi:SCP-2 sterol transfer family
MTYKTAYLWGPVSSFSGQLTAFLVQKGWHVHIATKGAFHIALSPLDLRSTAQDCLEKALGGRDKFKIFEERIRFLDVDEVSRGTTYDAFVFCGLPPNFDEARVSRAPWAAHNFSQTVKRFKNIPIFIVSSLWGAVQSDGVVPEEIECDRRKPLTPFEGVAQQYEKALLLNLGNDDTPWYLVRLPMMSGSSLDGSLANFSGPLTLLERLSAAASGSKDKSLLLSYNPDATMWFSPVDLTVQLFWRLIEDDQRPRITNLVSTQTHLNQEWLQHLAKALGRKKATSADSDSFNLPTFLRKALNDNVLVTTRGLFEVAGRYQTGPLALDDEYFQKVLNFGQERNWGKVAPPSLLNGKHHDQPINPETAKKFLTEFMPSHVDSQTVKQVTADENGIAFKVEDEAGLEWVLKAENGSAVVHRFDAEHPEPKVRFYFTPKGMSNLIERKVSLEKALVLREARVEGKPIEVLRACNFLKKFLKEHPFVTN